MTSTETRCAYWSLRVTTTWAAQQAAASSALIASMSKKLMQPSWWNQYRGIASKNYLEFVDFELAATATLNYQPLWIPGLLQTREYATEIIRQLGPDSDEDRRRLFDFRMKRQELLDAADIPSLSFVLDESVLRRQVGSEDVMAAQLVWLTELAGRSSITIQVRPFSKGLVRRMQAPFVIHQLTETTDFDLLYLEGPVEDTTVADDKEEIGQYRSAFDELKNTSLSPAESVTFIKEVAESQELAEQRRPAACVPASGVGSFPGGCPERRVRAADRARGRRLITWRLTETVHAPGRQGRNRTPGVAPHQGNGVLIWDVTVQALGDGDWRPSMSWLDVVELLGG